MGLEAKRPRVGGVLDYWRIEWKRNLGEAIEVVARGKIESDFLGVVQRKGR